MKKALLLLVVFLLQTTSAFAAYSDVPQNHKYYKAIQELESQNRLPKTNTLQPDKILTEAEFYELLFIYAKASMPKSIDLPFTNIKKSHSHSAYLQKALNLNLLIPRGQEFNLQKAISKQQALKTTFKALGIGATYFFHEPTFPFKDVKIESDTAPIAVKAAEIGIFEDTNPKLFRGASRLTKGKFIDYLYKIQQYSPSSNQITVTFHQNNTYNKTQQELLDHQSFDTFLDVWTKLKEDYYYQEEVNDQELITGAIQGLVQQLDDIYTVYNTPEEAQSFLQVLTNEYEGVGMLIEIIDEDITIISPFKNSPAEKAGLRPNDVIIKVNNENVVGKSLEYVVSKIKGKANTKVKITVERGDITKTFDVTRELVTYKSVNHSIKETSGKKIGYIELNRFAETTYADLLAAADDLLAQDIEGLIIDLRNNPGGYMNSAIRATGLFTKEKVTAVELKFSDGQSQKYTTSGDGRLGGLKTIVLMNEGSASASEILAGALKDHGIATLVGTKSFGKGTVQQLSNYQDGSMFKYTMSKWFTPDGYSIDQKGLQPDITVKNEDGSDAQLRKALDQF